MKRLLTHVPAALLVFLAASCFDRDILNISDSVEINSRYSVPVGAYDADINAYFEGLYAQGPSSGDSVYYEGVLYPVDESYVDFSFSDSLTFNLIKDPEGKVKSVEFVFLVSNGYPTPAVVQVYFMSGPTVIDSAFVSGPRVIDPGELNSEGIVGEPSLTMITIAMPADFNDNISSVRGIMVKGSVYLTRPDIQWVKFQSRYKINLHIGARIELLFNVNDL